MGALEKMKVNSTFVLNNKFAHSYIRVLFPHSCKNSYKHVMLTPQKCYGKYGGTQNWNNGSSFLRYDAICHLR